MKVNILSSGLTFTLSLLLCPNDSKWVTGGLSRCKRSKTEEEQLGVTDLLLILSCPAHD